MLPEQNLTIATIGQSNGGGLDCSAYNDGFTVRKSSGLWIHCSCLFCRITSCLIIGLYLSAPPPRYLRHTVQMSLIWRLLEKAVYKPSAPDSQQRSRPWPRPLGPPAVV